MRMCKPMAVVCRERHAPPCDTSRIAEFCAEAGIRDFWLVLNKIEAPEVETMLMDKLGELRDRVLGIIAYDQELILAGLSGAALGECPALGEAERVVEALERRLSVGARSAG